VQGQPETYGQVLLPSDVGKAFHEVSGANRRKAKSLGPLGEGACHRSGSGVFGEVVPWVRGQGDRDAKPGLRSQLLKPVVPFRQPLRVLGRPDKVEMSQQLSVDHVLSAPDPESQARFGKITASDHDHGLEQHAGLLGQAHPVEKIINPLLDVQLRVVVVLASSRRARTLRHALILPQRRVVQ
jgi:hypothetical protein